MQLHQLSVAYSAEHDRLLLRVNTTEQEALAVWLTRRLMLRLWPVLSQTATDQLFAADPTTPAPQDQGLRRMLADFRQEEALKDADFATPFQEQALRWPLGTEPLLASEVQLTPLPDGGLRLQLQEPAPAGADSSAATAPPRGFQMELAPHLVQGLLKLMAHALEQAGWEQPFAPLPAPSLAAPTAPDGSRLLN